MLETGNENSGSVTGWIEQLKDKNPEAQRLIWQRFVSRLITYATRRMTGINSPVVDAEDIACMTFQNFFDKTPGQFSTLVNRNDLWQILAVLAERRVVDEYRKSNAKKNGSNQLVNETRLAGQSESGPMTLDSFAAPGIQQPDFAMILSEEIETRLDSLKDDLLQKIALARMHGYRNQEIANLLGISLRSVERKLGIVREKFKKQDE